MADDAPRTLTCLIEGESKLFGVEPTRGMSIMKLMKLVWEEGKQGVLSNIDAKDLILWKVDLALPPDEELKDLAGKDVPGSVKLVGLVVLNTISSHWPATTPLNSQHLHVIVELQSEHPTLGLTTGDRVGAGYERRIPLYPHRTHFRETPMC